MRVSKISVLADNKYPFSTHYKFYPQISANTIFFDIPENVSPPFYKPIIWTTVHRLVIDPLETYFKRDEPK